jgi:hypothetical protein
MMMMVIAARIHWINHAFMTIVVSFIPLCSKRWWTGATANNFLLKYFFQKICKKLELRFMIKSIKRIMNGMIIPILMLRK